MLTSSPFADDDVVVFVDAFDVMVFGGRKEILHRFYDLEKVWKRSLVFNAEEVCFPDMHGVCNATEYPESPTRWRYLNSGLIAGRGHALKKMLLEPVPDVIMGSDQFWYQKFRKEHPDDVILDTNCTLLCALWAVGTDGSGTELRDGRVVVTETGTMPPFVHFVSIAHWTKWVDGRASSTLCEVFRKVHPEASWQLLDQWWIGAQLGSTHDIVAYHGAGFWATMRAFICFECNILGTTQSECQFFRVNSTHCRWLLPIVIMIAALLLILTRRMWTRLLLRVLATGLSHAMHAKIRRLIICLKRSQPKVANMVV